MYKSSKEIWRNIPNYEGLYQVSALGRVRSLDRHIVDSAGKKRFLRGKILRSGITKGYPIISLCIKGVIKSCFVHRLVMSAFKGECPEGKEVAHNNGIRSDNKLTNLRYTTRIENQHDRRKHNTSNAKLTEEEVKEIRTRVKNCSQKDLAKEYGVVQATISHIITKRNWKHI